LLQKADIGVALFGTDYNQWNTAMDLSTGIAMGKPSIMIRPESLIHPLKELSRKPNVTVESDGQAAAVLADIYEQPWLHQGRRLPPTLNFSCGLLSVIMARLLSPLQMGEAACTRTSCYGKTVTTSPKEVGSHACI